MGNAYDKCLWVGLLAEAIPITDVKQSAYFGVAIVQGARRWPRTVGAWVQFQCSPVSLEFFSFLLPVPLHLFEGWAFVCHQRLLK
jgi:hypothetical protein